ncbi:MAG: type II secretion system protein [Alphaproteobacteria bacterium]
MKKLLNDQSGMTLIDVAIAMVILGLIAVPMIGQYREWKYEKEKGTTTGNYAAINKAIADYYFENNIYPCPADPTLGPGDLTYGDSDCAAAAVPGSPGVLIGAVPLATLKIPVETNLDGWSNKITYAVTTAMTDTVTWLPATLGALTVQGRLPSATQCGGAIGTIQSNAHYALVSHGPTGTGAFTAQGNPREACPAAGDSADAENCIPNNVFVDEECMASDGADNFYDDLIFAEDSIPSRIWEDALEADPTDIISSAERVGINTQDPQATLHVVGNIKAEQSDANSICDESGAGCFRAGMIGGADPMMKCSSSPAATSSAMSGISEARAKCQSGYTAAKLVCASGKLIKGMDSDGGLICGN